MVADGGQGNFAGLGQTMAAVDQVSNGGAVTLFLCGDVMLGRGVDQILPHPCTPVLYEQHVGSAIEYVRLAEARNGPVPKPVTFDYVWGDALAVLDRRQPHCRIINLETAITTSSAAERKGINYRMNPANIGVLTEANIDACMLANNHVLDWGRRGLVETLVSLEEAGIASVGAGRNLADATASTVLPVAGNSRVIISAFGSTTSGIPARWSAEDNVPGVNLLPECCETAIYKIRESVRALKQQGDIAVASVHWGGNWGYDISETQRTIAHRLIDRAAVDVIHGHSSHHPKAIEVYRGKLILYGCGDFINDYEGIRGYEEFRSDLTLAYFARIDACTGELLELEMIPFRIRRLRLERADHEDTRLLAKSLDRTSCPFGARVEAHPDDYLRLLWG